MNELGKELRELAWLPSVATGLSVLAVGPAITLAMTLERLPAGTSTLYSGATSVFAVPH
jgi:hypothetical protein